MEESNNEEHSPMEESNTEEHSTRENIITETSPNDEDQVPLAELVSDNAINQQIDWETNEILKTEQAHGWSLVKEIHKRSNSFLPASYRLENTPVSVNLTKDCQVIHQQDCICSIDFSACGQRFVTASYRRSAALWEMNSSKPIAVWDYGLMATVKQVLMLPLSEEMTITASRNGHILLTQFVSGKIMKSANLFMCEDGHAPTISVNPYRPYEVLSCFEDSTIYNIDIRTTKPSFISSCKDDSGNPIELSLIKSDPRPTNYFSVAGRDQCIRIYDRRMNRCFCRYKPSNMPADQSISRINSMVYSKSGDAILASYEAGDIYLFSTANSDEISTETHKYSGHLNENGVQSVCFFGNNCQYVVSGSDSRHIFIWDRCMENIKNILKTGDYFGASCLEVHPKMPLLASGSIDSCSLNMWAWQPGVERLPAEDMRSIVRSNLSEKRETLNEFDRQTAAIMWTSSFENIVRPTMTPDHRQPTQYSTENPCIMS